MSCFDEVDCVGENFFVNKIIAFRYVDYNFCICVFYQIQILKVALVKVRGVKNVTNFITSLNFITSSRVRIPAMKYMIDTDRVIQLHFFDSSNIHLNYNIILGD